jgi:phenylacetate-CoA ligase
MHKVQTWEPDRIRDLQWQKLSALLSHAYESVPYYRRVFENLGARPEDVRSPDNFAQMPALSKEDVRENLENMISETSSRKGFRPDRTSGSTGESLYFYKDQGTSEARRASNIRMDEWIGIEIGDPVAFLWATPTDLAVSGRLRGRLRNWLSNHLLLSHFDMDDETLSEYAMKLRRFGPRLLQGYPSGLTRFAEYLLHSGATIPAPRAILTSGETLYEEQRTIVERALGAPLYNHYGCREFGAVARECRVRHGMHVGVERLYVETRPLDGAVPGTAPEEILITDLHNYGMPLIRYAIGDLGSLSWEKCDCGLTLPRLVGTMGRTFDLVRAPNGNYIGGTFWTIMLKDAGGVENLQVIQEALDHLRIVLVTNPDFSEGSRRFIREKVGEKCGPKMRVDIETVEEIPRTPGGKLRLVISRL